MSANGLTQAAKRKGFTVRTRRDMQRNWQLYLLVLPAIVAIFMFCYVPMYGVQIAFKDFRPIKGIWGSEWVGMTHFMRFFRSYQFVDLLRNTLLLSLYSIIAGFPMPILLALMLNQISAQRFKRILQTVTYMPHFISTVVMVGMLLVFLSPSTGLFGHMMRALGVAEPPNLMGEKELFRSIYVLSDIWQHTGWDSIIYLAALSAVDLSLYEAATVDGANKLQRMWNIDIPCLLPTVIILLILRAGNIMSVGFEKDFLMQNDLNLPVSEIISTYVYKLGLKQAQYSFSAAVGLFNTVINFVLLIVVNSISRRVGETSLW